MRRPLPRAHRPEAATLAPPGAPSPSRCSPLRLALVGARTAALAPRCCPLFDALASDNLSRAVTNRTTCGRSIEAAKVVGGTAFVARFCYRVRRCSHLTPRNPSPSRRNACSRLADSVRRFLARYSNLVDKSFTNHGDPRLFQRVRTHALTTLYGMLRAVAADARGFRLLCLSRGRSRER